MLARMWRTLTHYLQEGTMMQLFWKAVWLVLRMLHIEWAYDLAIPLLDHVNTCPHKNLPTNVHGSITHSDQKVETIQTSTNRWMNTQNMICSNSGILFGHKEKWSTAICHIHLCCSRRFMLALGNGGLGGSEEWLLTSAQFHFGVMKIF